jgi:hypothetical protein
LLQPFVERMPAATAKTQPAWTSWMALEPIIESSLIGTEADIRGKIHALERDINPYSLILKTISPELDKRREDLRVFGNAIRPSLDS